MVSITGLGHQSRRFLSTDSSKPCIIGGVIFKDMPGLLAENDGDVVFQAICNAITSLTHVPILGDVAKNLCKKNGITDSKVYLQKALESLECSKILHVAICLEGKRPRFQKKIYEIRQSICQALNIDINKVGVTSSSGQGLTDFGCGEGIQCLCQVTINN